MKTKTHIGKLIQKEFKKTHHTVIWLAKKVGYSRNNIYNIFEKETIDTGVLILFCRALHFNFFKYYDKYVDEEIL
jgi:plasmid maintenance system antidote protein VapI